MHAFDIALPPGRPHIARLQICAKRQELPFRHFPCRKFLQASRCVSRCVVRSASSCFVLDFNESCDRLATISSSTRIDEKSEREIEDAKLAPPNMLGEVNSDPPSLTINSGQDRKEEQNYSEEVEPPQLNPSDSDEFAQSDAPLDSTLRRSQRKWNPSAAFLESLATASAVIHQPENAVIMCLQSLTPTQLENATPSSHEEASRSEYAREWLTAEDIEIKAQVRNQTFGPPTDLPPGFQAIPCMWVYRIKTKSDGSIERFKARIVIKGFKMKPGQDFNETFAPVARITIRVCYL